MENATIILDPAKGWSGDTIYAFHADPAPAPTLDAGWRRDGDSLRVHADRLGMAPLYLGAKDGTVAVSTSAVEAARAIRSPLDADAMAVFLRIGFLLDEDTLFAHVRALMPGEVLHVARDGTIRSTGGGISSVAADTTITRAQIEDRYIDLTTRAIEARLSDTTLRYGVPLSGGRDSRHILLGSHAGGRTPDFVATHYAMPPQRDEDMRVAAELATALGVEHRRSAIDFDRFVSDAARKNAALDFHTDEHHWYLPLAESLAPQLDVLMDGLGGDTLINNLFQRKGFVEAIRAGRHEQAARLVLGTGDPIPWLAPALRTLFSYDRAVARLAASLATLTDSPDPAKEFQFWNRTRREIALAPLKIYPPLIDRITLPFLDAEIAAFARSLPWEAHGGPGIHDAVIHRAYPDFAAIGFERKGAGARFTRPESRAMLRDYARFRREAGSTRFADRYFVPSRLLRARLKGDVSGAFWWMFWTTYMQGLERTLAGMETDFGAAISRAEPLPA